MTDGVIHTEAPGIIRIDHGWEGPGHIASYLLHDRDALALVESGPASTLPALLAGIRAAGHDPAALTHVLLTHIHLDHAAGAGQLAQLAPRARIVVHARGAPHLADPSRLLASARRLYGDAMEAMYGTMIAIDPARIDVAGDGDEVRVGTRRVRAMDTPGHAAHHLAFHLVDEDAVFTGDVAGIRLDRVRHARPPTPPPEVDTDAWLRSIERIRAVRPRLLMPTHFGAVDDAEWHLDDLAGRLRAWTALAGEHAEGSADNLAAALAAHSDPEVLDATGDAAMVRRYADLIPYEAMAQGLLRQERKRAES